MWIYIKKFAFGEFSELVEVLQQSALFLLFGVVDLLKFTVELQNRFPLLKKPLVYLVYE